MHNTSTAAGADARSTVLKTTKYTTPDGSTEECVITDQTGNLPAMNGLPSETVDVGICAIGSGGTITSLSCDGFAQDSLLKHGGLQQQLNPNDGSTWGGSSSWNAPECRAADEARYHELDHSLPAPHRISPSSASTLTPTTPTPTAAAGAGPLAVADPMTDVQAFRLPLTHSACGSEASDAYAGASAPEASRIAEHLTADEASAIGWGLGNATSVDYSRVTALYRGCRGNLLPVWVARYTAHGMYSRVCATFWIDQKRTIHLLGESNC
jgi:hypothetical protein